jgi:hypothetical protein
MTPANWIKKKSTCPIVAAEAIQLLEQSVIQYQLSSDSLKQNYIEQIKKNLKNADLYAEKYVLAAKAFLKIFQ